MPVPITLTYTALFGFFLILLGGLVWQSRHEAQVDIGPEGHKDLERIIRAQASFAEYVPLTLLLIALLELNGSPAPFLHLLGTGLLVSRIVHAFSLSRSSARTTGRLAGIVLTWLVLLSASLTGLIRALDYLTGLDG